MLRNIDAALEVTKGGPRARAIALNKFWGDHQQFFRQVICAFKVPSVIAETEAALSEGKTKRVSPHTIRHTTATHLLRAGVDINTIRAWLGHVSLNTTNIYAEVDLEMKAKALATCEVPSTKPAKRTSSSNRNW